MSMNPLCRLTCCIVATALALLTPRPAQAQQPTRKLNVLLIISDDLNMNVGCYGRTPVKTPNLDRLAARGVRFDRAYTQYPLCNPSRTSFLSGLRPATTKVYDNTTPPRQTIGDVAFLNELFRARGYFTARVGKILHGPFASAAKWDVSDEPKKKGKNKPKQKDARKEGEGVQQQGGLKITWRATERRDDQEPDGVTARRIVGLLEKSKDRPFFIAAGFHKPHLPFVAPKKYFALYPPDKVALPKEPADVRKGVPPVAFTRTKGDDQMTDREKREAIAAYYACVSFMDAQVGVILDALERLGLSDNTVVIFLSDHGFHLSEHGGLWRKMTLFEQSCRVPLIVAAPGARRGAACPRLVELVDLYPTLAELCRLPAPAKLEGTSFVPLLHEPDRPWKKGAFTTVSRRNGKLLGQSVRTERYRYTEWGSQKAAELYDHQTDPQEFRNLANDPGHAQTAAELRRLLHGGWRAALPPARKER
jgi:iduronate 2-sulfatase